MNGTIAVRVCNCLNCLQLGIAFAKLHDDTMLLDMCEAVFSALVSRNMRLEVVLLPRDPCEKYLDLIQRVVEGAYKWKQPIF